MSARILVIDDDPSILEVLTEILTTEGHSVTISSTAVTVHQVADADVDLVILDLLLNDRIGGWEILRRIKSDVSLASLPVIVMSADMDTIHARADEAARMQGVWMVIKPFTLDGLMATLKAALEEAESPESPKTLRRAPYSSEFA